MWMRCSTLTSWTTLHTAVLLALPPALSRISRKPLALLDDVLDAFASLTTSAFSSFLTEHSDSAVRAAANLPHMGDTAAYALEALKSLVHKLAAAVQQWPTETSEAALLKIQSSQLRALDDSTLRVPLAYDPSSDIDKMPLPLPALLECINNKSTEEKRKHGAQFVVYMTSALLSTGLYFWQDVGSEEFDEGGLQAQMNRGRALAAHCLLCAKGFEAWTTAGKMSGTAFLQGVSQLACVLLEAAEGYQVNPAFVVRPLAATDACTSKLLPWADLCSSYLQNMPVWV
jgi:hypothetical protein